MLMLLFVLDRVPSFHALWERLTKGRCPGCPCRGERERALQAPACSVARSIPGAAASHHALAGDEPAAAHVGGQLGAFAQRVLAIDDTTLDALARKTEWLKGFEKGRRRP